MTDYFVDGDNGSNSNNGLGADADDATNKPWLTIGYALGSSSPMTGGDTVYIKPGTYRETVTLQRSPSSEMKIVGDVHGAQGWKVRSAGPVIWSANSDATTMGSNRPLNLNGKSHITVERVVFWRGTGHCVRAVTGTSTNITLRRCQFRCASQGNSNSAIQLNYAAGSTVSWLIEGCVIDEGTTGVQVYAVGHTSDYDIDFEMRNCLIYGGAQVISISNWGSGSGRVYGFRFTNCEIRGRMSMTASNLRTSSASVTMRGCVGRYPGSYVVSTNSGAVDEDYCTWVCAANSGVTQGTNSVREVETGDSIGFDRLVGLPCMEPGQPWPGSHRLGFDGHSGPLSEYIDGRPRPIAATGGDAGPVAAQSMVRETSTTRTGSLGGRINGQGSHAFQVAVESGTSHTISVYVQVNGTYDESTSWPKITVSDHSAGGVATASDTATSTCQSGWEELTLTFTPGRTGFVTLVCESHDEAAGECYWDDLTVS